MANGFRSFRTGGGAPVEQPAPFTRFGSTGATQPTTITSPGTQKSSFLKGVPWIDVLNFIGSSAGAYFQLKQAEEADRRARERERKEDVRLRRLEKEDVRRFDIGAGFEERRIGLQERSEQRDVMDQLLSERPALVEKLNRLSAMQAGRVALVQGQRSRGPAFQQPQENQPISLIGGA